MKVVTFDEASAASFKSGSSQSAAACT